MIKKIHPKISFDSKKKKLIGSILFIIVVLAVLFAILLLNSSQKNALLKLIFEEDKPIAFKKDGKYGYMNTKGEELIEPIFFNAEPFYGDYAVVTDEEDGVEIYKIIDRKGEEVLKTESASKPQYYSEYGIWLIENKLYSQKMKKIFEDSYHIDYISKGYFSFLDNERSSSGIIDSKGKKVFSWDEDYISVTISKTIFGAKKAYAAISNFEEREEIISLQNGKKIFELEDPKNQYLEVEEDNVFRIISREDNYKTIKWMYIDDDEIAFSSEDDIYSIEIDDVKRDILRIDYGKNFEVTGRTEQYAYYDLKNKKYLDEKYGREESTGKNDWMQDVYGYKTYTCSGQYGLMKKDKILLDCIHTSISFLEKKTYDYLEQYHKKPLAIVKKDAKVELYDMKKKKVLESFEPAAIAETDESSFLVFTEMDTDGFTKVDYVVYNAITGLSKKFLATDKIEVYSNYITVSDGSFKTYYTTEFKEIYRGEI